MSQLQQSLIEALRIAHRNTYAPVTSVAVASLCYISDRWARKQLNVLAAAGVVRRVGSRCGWLPVEAV